MEEEHESYGFERQIEPVLEAQNTVETPGGKQEWLDCQSEVIGPLGGGENFLEPDVCRGGKLFCLGNGNCGFR